MFPLFDHLSLCNAFQHFAFCTSTCDINRFCFVCSIVYFKDICVNNLSRKMFLGVHFKQTTQYGL